MNLYNELNAEWARYMRDPYHRSIIRPSAQVNLGAAPAAPALIDALLESCPTDAEVQSIHKDFKIVIDASVLPSMRAWSCTKGGRENSIMLSLYNSFRVMKLLTFDAPMPLIGATNMYDWLRSLGLTFHVITSAAVGGYNNAEGRDVYLLAEGLGGQDNRVWLNSSTQFGLMHFPALLLHEARHTVPGGGYPHNCSSWDSSLSFGGAWALQYYYYLWLANHSGPYMTQMQRIAAADTANWIRQTHFCDAQRQSIESIAPTMSSARSAMLSNVLASDAVMFRSSPQARPIAKRMRAAGQADAPPPSVSPVSLVVVGVLALGAIAIFAATVTMDAKPRRRSRAR